MDTILSDAFTWKWTLKESGAQDLFSDDFRTFDTSFVNGYRFYFSNHLQASLFLLLCYYLSLLCWKWITFILECKNGNIYFHSLCTSILQCLHSVSLVMFYCCETCVFYAFDFSVYSISLHFLKQTRIAFSKGWNQLGNKCSFYRLSLKEGS